MPVLQQIQNALHRLNPEKVRQEAAQPLSVELDALVRAPEPDVDAILARYPDFSLALASRLPAFRRPVIRRIVKDISAENALFAMFTALPSAIPSVLTLGWTAGEFVSDTAVLTGNQVRMAFMIAAASDSPVGYAAQKSQIASIILGAFGWRAMARELVGKIPFGEGLIPKAAVAYAGTYAVGRGLDSYHRIGRWLTSKERLSAYREGLESGRRFARWALGPEEAQTDK